MFRHVLILLGILGFCCGLVTVVLACEKVGRRGATVRIAEESAIIVWDSKAKLQHFIRRATFATSESDFGFLVPTPTQPRLAESSNSSFRLLDKLTEPEVVYDKEYHFSPPIGCGDKTGAPPRVQVLEEKRVAGYDAAVLEADSASALNDWLKSHDYVSRPELTAWLEPYVRAGWKITAFKISQDPDSRKRIATSAVRMTFATEKPFFPYSESADHEPDEKTYGRLLRVFFIAEGRYEGWLKEKLPWPGQTVWTGPLPTEAANDLAAKLDMTLPESASWLTVFEDTSSPRPGTTDVNFAACSSQDLVRRPRQFVKDHRDLSGFVCLGVPLLFLVVIGFRRWRVSLRSS